MKEALFLDRDGVINVAPPRGEYILRPGQFELMEGISELMQTAHDKDYFIAVVTNQPQIARGMITASELGAIHRKMDTLLSGLIDVVYVCPHSNEDACSCRKPKPGMLTRGAQEHGIDLKRSLIVGDSDKDILAGQAAGVKTVFIKNDLNASELPKCQPDHIIKRLPDVVPLL